jgi:hypothetical protein
LTIVKALLPQLFPPIALTTIDMPRHSVMRSAHPTACPACPEQSRRERSRRELCRTGVFWLSCLSLSCCVLLVNTIPIPVNPISRHFALSRKHILGAFPGGDEPPRFEGYWKDYPMRYLRWLNTAYRRVHVLFLTGQRCTTRKGAVR